MKKRFLFTLLCLIMTVAMLSGTVLADDPGYTFDPATGELTINNNAGATAWVGTVDPNTVTSLTVASTVSLDNAFNESTSLKSVAFRGGKGADARVQQRLPGRIGQEGPCGDFRLPAVRVAGDVCVHAAQPAQQRVRQMVPGSEQQQGQGAFSVRQRPGGEGQRVIAVEVLHRQPGGEQSEGFILCG